MPQFYPDGPAAVNLSSAIDAGGINVPSEPASEFNTPGMQGSMQQILSENLGKFVIADFLIGVSTIVRRVGILYSVGRGFVVIYNEDYHSFQVCDIFSLKFVGFFPPGFEPSVEDLLSGQYTSGILNPERTGGQSLSDSTFTAPSRASGSAPSVSGAASSGMSSRGPAVNGCRTLGQR